MGDPEKPEIAVILASRFYFPADTIRIEVSEALEKRYSVFLEEIEKTLDSLSSEANFSYHYVSSSIDAIDVLRKTQNVVGYLVFAFEHPTGYLRSIMRSGKPTIVIAYTYVGAGELLQSYPIALGEEYPVLGVAVRNITNPERIKKYVRYLLTLYKLRNSKVLVIVSPVVKQYLEVGYPLAVNVYGMISDIQKTFGVKVSSMDINTFRSKYYDKIPDDSAKQVASKWFKEAREVIEHSEDELIKPAKLYLALKKLVEDLKLDAVAIDCITLYHAGFIDTWPCLAFMELTKEGIVCGCEGDLYSVITMLIMKYLADLPGFINDPSPDMDNGEIVYYHCFAPINFYGFERKELLPYVIIPAHWGTKKLSIRVDFPSGIIATSVGVDAKNRTISIHTAKILRNELGPEECSVKVVGAVNVGSILERWNPEAGWHRVLFYGDHREDLKNFARLLGLRIIEEDR
jgi:hypothetical protein